jgi:hypothetical protein
MERQPKRAERQREEEVLDIGELARGSFCRGKT